MNLKGDMIKLSSLVVVVLVLSACGGAKATPTPVPEPTATVAQGAGLPTLDQLENGWNQLEPGGDTICSTGTDYAFFVRPADTGKLLIYFQGGGACWFGSICDLASTPTYDPFVDASDNPALYTYGIFDLDNPENPFGDYSIVFVPYCTGDVHIGNRDRTYTVAEREVTIHHKGYVNATAVLDWTFENFSAVETVFVTGSSAGSIASPFYAALVAERYPEARIAQLGDASGGYRNVGLSGVFASWGTLDILPDFPEYRDVTDEELTFETFYVATGSRYPDLTLAQYNTAGDAVQVFFLGLVGSVDASFQELLEANLADINGAIDNFRTFTAAGKAHAILVLPEFYTDQVDGIRFRDWIAALAAGEDVENVMCTECELAE